GTNVDALFVLLYIGKHSKDADPKFPNRQLVLKCWCQVHEALASPSRDGRLVRQLPTNLGKDATPVERAKRLQLLDRQFVDHNFVGHASPARTIPRRSGQGIDSVACHWSETLGIRPRRQRPSEANPGS